MIRSAGITDLDALVNLENISFASDSFTRRHFRYFLSYPRTVVMVEEQGSTIVGMIVVRWRKGAGSAHVYTVAVHPDWRGKGVGRRLMKECEGYVQAHGLASVDLEVREDNLVARRMYESLGYRAVDRVAGYYSDGEAAIKYAKSFAQPLATTEATHPP